MIATPLPDGAAPTVLIRLIRCDNDFGTPLPGYGKDLSAEQSSAFKSTI